MDISSLPLQGKNAIVTGSTSGIGQGIAQTLARAGCNVMINGFGDADQIEADRRALEAEHGVEARYHGGDLTKPEAIRELIQSTVDAWGGLDILVNNAGVQHVEPIESFPPEKWNLIISLNLSAAFHTMQQAVPHMRARGWGRIVNIASAHALVASPYKAAYVAAKHGIAGLTKVVALETAEEQITCNAICPGYVWTPLVEGQVADTAKARGISEEEVKRDVLLKAQPTKAFTTIEDIGALTVHLCDEAASNITGSLLPMDGGWTAH